MSGAPTGKQQSERELKTARTLNTVATIGAGHALYAMTPEKHRLKIREGMLKIAPKKVRPKVESGLNALKQPEIGGKLGTAGKVVAGGWLALHGGELAGDIMARRSINNQLEQAQKNKGKVNTVKKNDQSMISKADGSVSGNGNGKAIDATGIIAVPAGAYYVARGAKLNTKAKRVTERSKIYGEKAKTLKAKSDAAARLAHKPGADTATRYAQSEKLGQQSAREAAKEARLSQLAGKVKVARNKNVLLGGALIGGTGIERAYNAKKVEKDYVSKRLPSVLRTNRVFTGPDSKYIAERRAGKAIGDDIARKISRNKSLARRVNAEHPLEQKVNPIVERNFDPIKQFRQDISDILENSAIADKRAFNNKINRNKYLRDSIDRRESERALATSSPKSQNNIKRNAAVGIAGAGTVGAGAYGIKSYKGKQSNKKRSEIKKAQRRFDPEADRQRRIGQASVAGPALGYLLAERASRNFTTDVGRTAQGKKIRGIAVKPGRGKAGTLLALGSAAATGTGVAAYRHGLSVRNQPWT